MAISEVREKLTIENVVDRTIGVENVVQFREDFKRLMYEHNERFQKWNETDTVLRRQATEGYHNSQDTSWNTAGFVLGILGIFTAVVTLGPWSTVLGLLSGLVTLGTALRKVTVTILAFENPHRERGNRRLKFVKAWNCGVMTSWKAMLVLALGLLIRYFPDAYKLALWALEDEIENRSQ